MFAEFIDAYGLEIIWAVVCAVATYLGFVIKKLYTRFINDKTKKEVVETVVQGVEQMYKNLHGEEKLNKALEAAAELLTSKGISATTFELQLLIEAAVGKFNDAFNKNATENGETTEEEAEEVETEAETEVEVETEGEGVND